MALENGTMGWELAEGPEVGLALAWKRGSRSLLIPGFRALAHRAVEQVRRSPAIHPTAPSSHPVAEEAP